VAIYFFAASAAAAAAAALCSTMHYGALELTDCISLCSWPVFGHHTAVIAVNIILLKSCCTIFG